jgi:hypothetical protein
MCFVSRLLQRTPNHSSFLLLQSLFDGFVCFIFAKMFKASSEEEENNGAYRMVRLLKACCLGGNGHVAMLLTSGSDAIGIEECCSALLSHFRVDQQEDNVDHLTTNSSTISAGSEEGVNEGGYRGNIQTSTKERIFRRAPSHAFMKNGEAILRKLTPLLRLIGDGEEEEEEEEEEGEAKSAKSHSSQSSSLSSLFAPQGGGANGGGVGVSPDPAPAADQEPKRRRGRPSKAPPSFVKDPSSVTKVPTLEPAVAAAGRGNHSAEAHVTLGAVKSERRISSSITKRQDDKNDEEVRYEVVGSAALTSSERYEDAKNNTNSLGGQQQQPQQRNSAFELLSLLVELVDSLPLSSTQVRSPLLWECVEVVCAPVVSVLARNRSPLRRLTHGPFSTSDRMVGAEVVDLLERLLTKGHQHNVIEGACALL